MGDKTIGQLKQASLSCELDGSLPLIRASVCMKLNISLNEVFYNKKKNNSWSFHTHFLEIYVKSL
jgi:hypothetical protein